MQIDVVIGNPPYQEDNSQNGRQAKSLYDKFIDMGIKTTNRLLVFITNNTFLTNDSKKDLRDKMIQAGLNKLYNYPISGDVFKGVGVSACIFSIDKQMNSNQFEYKRIENNKVINEYTNILNTGDIIAESEYELSIPRKVNTIKNMGSISFGDKVFGIASSGRIGFDGKGEIIDYSMIEFEGCVVLKNKFKDSFGDVYVNRTKVPRGTEYIDLYKVICPLIISKSSINSFNKAEILNPNVICTQNWSTIGIFKEKQSALNLIKYAKTKLFQFLAYDFASNAMTSLSKVLMSHIPLQDFTSASDIDWSQSIADIDKQLYRKYNLTPEEINIIESVIKERK